MLVGTYVQYTGCFPPPSTHLTPPGLHPSPQTTHQNHVHAPHIEIIATMASKIEFSPAMPIPLVFDVQKRIEQLQSFLDPNDPNYQPEEQHTNIKAVIKL